MRQVRLIFDELGLLIIRIIHNNHIMIIQQSYNNDIRQWTSNPRRSSLTRNSPQLSAII